MDIRPIANNSEYPIYNENTQSNEVNQSQRPREEIEAELNEVEHKLAELIENKYMWLKERDKLGVDLLAREQELKRIGINPDDDRIYQALANAKESASNLVENKSEEIINLELKRDKLYQELGGYQIDGLPPKPKPESKSDSSKSTGLFDLLRKEPEKLS